MLVIETAKVFEYSTTATRKSTTSQEKNAKKKAFNASKLSFLTGITISPSESSYGPAMNGQLMSIKDNDKAELFDDSDSNPPIYFIFFVQCQVTILLS